MSNKTLGRKFKRQFKCNNFLRVKEYNIKLSLYNTKKITYKKTAIISNIL
jgi:hypothetical protein